MKILPFIIHAFVSVVVVCLQGQSAAGESPGVTHTNQSQPINGLIRSTNSPDSGNRPNARNSAFDYSRYPDPFFPKRQRETTNSPAVNLHLDGISFGLAKRLAIINGRTLAVDEHAEVKLREARTLIRCVRIDEDSAVIEIVATGEQQTLQLKSQSLLTPSPSRNPGDG